MAMNVREARVGPTVVVVTGIVAGVVGGVGFGIFMHARGMLPLVANLVGGSTAGLGWLVHLAISVFVGVTFSIIGVAFALVFARRATGLASSTLLGVGYGAFWWVLGGLLLMPLWLGIDAFTFDAIAWASLAGHLIYGLLLGITYGVVASWLARRNTPPDGRQRLPDGGHAGPGRDGVAGIEADARRTVRRHGPGRG